MPNVSPYELKGNTGAGFVNPVYVKGHNGSSFQFGYAVYYHNGSGWVEVWNARPEVVSTSMATTGSGLTFSGTADPNNFSTTAKFEYKEVGGSYSNSGTTTTGMGDGIDGAVSYTVTATVADTYKNWESRASATNAGGTGTGSTITLDCRKQGVSGGSGWSSTNSSPIVDPGGNCDSCGTRSRIDVTYTKSGCQQYVVTGSYGACSDSFVSADPGFTCFFATGVNGGTTGYYTKNFLGPGFVLSNDSQCEGAVYGNCTGNYLQGSTDVRYCGTTQTWRAYNTVCVLVQL